MKIIFENVDVISIKIYYEGTSYHKNGHRCQHAHQ